VTIYLDNCCLNRPYDDQAAPRVRLEAEAIELVLNAVVEARISLLWSETLDTENEQNPFEERRTGIARWKDSATSIIHDAPALRDRARALAADGFKPLDALHLASAATGGASHFLTVDDGILKKRGRVREIVIVSPLEFVQSFGEQL
jgi:predicted nucleic acid-binding protein